MVLSSYNIKKFLLKKFLRKFFMPQETEGFYISGNGNAQKILYISGKGPFLYFKRNLQDPKNQHF